MSAVGSEGVAAAGEAAFVAVCDEADGAFRAHVHAGTTRTPASRREIVRIIRKSIDRDISIQKRDISCIKAFVGQRSVLCTPNPRPTGVARPPTDSIGAARCAGFFLSFDEFALESAA